MISKMSSHEEEEEEVSRIFSVICSDHLHRRNAIHLLGPDSVTAIIDVVAPFLNVIKKSQHDYIKRVQTEMINTVERRMAEELITKPKLSMVTSSTYLSHDPQVKTLMYDSVMKLQNFTKSDGAAVYIVNAVNKEIYRLQATIFSDTQFDVHSYDKPLTLSAYVAAKKKLIVTDDVTKDGRFPKGLGETDICMKAVMGVPIRSPGGTVIAIIELCRGASKGPYNKVHVLTALNLAAWMGSSVGINIELNGWFTKNEFCHYLLHIINHISSTLQPPLENILNYYMTVSRDYIGASMGKFYVISPGKKDATDLLEVYNVGDKGSQGYEKVLSTSLNGAYSIVQYVVENNKILNLAGKDLKKYIPLRNDEHYFSCICAPIRCKNEVKGAVEFLNKLKGNKFSDDDEVAIKKIAMIGSLILKNLSHWHRKKKMDATVEMYLNLLERHLKSCDEAVEEVRSINEIPSNFLTFSFYPEIRKDEYLARLSRELFNIVLGFRHYEKVDLDHFMMSVVKFHRRDSMTKDFLHTFLCTHCVAVILYKNDNFFSEDEKEEMLLASLFHCLDVKSVTSRHSPSKTMLYITVFLKAFNIYSLKKKYCIFALIRAFCTNHSFIYHKLLLKYLLKGKFKWKNKLHRFLIKALIVRVAENSIWLKPFIFTASLAKMYFKEVSEVLAVKKKFICLKSFKNKAKEPFLDFLEKLLIKSALPDVQILSHILPNVEEMFHIGCDNLKEWRLIRNSDKCKIWQQETSWLNDGKEDPNSSIKFFDVIEQFYEQRN